MEFRLLPFPISVCKVEDVRTIDLTKEFYFINDFEIAEISRNNIKFYDFNLNPIEKKSQIIDLDHNIDNIEIFQDLEEENKDEPNFLEILKESIEKIKNL